MNTNEYQVAVIGGGIVGLGTALALTGQFPGLSLAVIEKEPQVAGHQTGHNSGVIHAGVYYRPGSHKARLCVEGGRLLTAFCEANGIRYERCGKLIVATDDSELSRLQALYERGAANGVVGLELVGPERAREIEPHAKAVRALYSPNTAIVDFSEVAEAMAKQLRKRAAEILPGTNVQAIRRQGNLYYLETNRTSVAARSLINCGGLYADRIARMMDINPGAMVIPFRGEYYSLRPERRLVRGLIYPVPDPEFPFLGVHFTRRIHGDFEAGPNAVLAFAREGYRRMKVNVSEVMEMLAFPGFWRMARRYWRTGAYEWHRSMSRRAFLRALQRLVPELEDRDLMPGGSGVRAQLVTRDGTLLDDFRILEAPNAIHVLNAPSPAATASIAIGRHIACIAAKSFELKP
jgi:L-2-hydroxyglutarate oxidase LhgO